MNASEIHIPLFPLNIFLLPGEQVPLHIFEERYRQLFSEAEGENKTFGLPFEDAELKYGYVSICRLVEVTKRYATGESDVIIEAFSIGKLKLFQSVFPSKQYPGGIIEVVENTCLDGAPDPNVLNAFEKYLSFLEGSVTLDLSGYRLVDIAASLKLSNTDKIKLIHTQGIAKQNAFLLRNLRYINLLLEQEKGIENGFILN